MPNDTDRQFITQGEGLPKWSNPISHAVAAGNMCFISGQLSVSNDGKYCPGTPTEEAMLAFSNVFAAAKAAGFEKDEIVYVDLAFDDLSDLDEVNQVYITLFEEGRRPARTVYEAAALPFGGKIKVVATAVKTTL